MSGVFSINSPEGLFFLLEKKLDVFDDEPTDERLIDVLFLMYHLREWVYPEGYGAFSHKEKNERTREEILYETLFDLPEYKIVQALCNKTKHFSDGKGGNFQTESVEFARAGLMRCDDRLDRTYHMVNGQDIREIFNAVFHLYRVYFMV